MTSRETGFKGVGDLSSFSPDRFGQILASAADITLIIDRDRKILNITVNPDQASLGRLDHWEGRKLDSFLTEESQSKLVDRLASLERDQQRLAAMAELNHVDNARWEFPVRYTIQRTGKEGNFILTGRDLRPVAEVQQQLVRAQLALEKDYEAYREFDTRYRVLMSAVREPVVIANAATGRILDANAGCAQLLGVVVDALIGSNLSAQFDSERRGDLIDNIVVAAGSGGGGSLTVTTRRLTRRVNLCPTLFRATGEMLVLCRLEPQDPPRQKTEELAGSLDSLFEATGDSIVFTDANGIIRQANEAFLILIDVAHVNEIKGRSLADFLQRGSVDLKVIIDNATRTGRMRMYATRLTGPFGGELSVEISAARLGSQPSAGFGLILRDAARREPVREPPPVGTDDDMRNIVDLVGSSPLKELVAATTDVIEKICIETAIDLTRNNRAAAAEMLGLSRQSLYVKLRKYGLVRKDATDEE